MAADAAFLLGKLGDFLFGKSLDRAFEHITRETAEALLAKVLEEWKAAYEGSTAVFAFDQTRFEAQSWQANAEKAALNVESTGNRFFWYEALAATWQLKTASFYEEVHAPLMDLATRLANTCARFLATQTITKPPLVSYRDEMQPVPDLIGREQELAGLMNMLAAPAAFSWWTVTGEAGIGKTRVVHEVMQELGPTWDAGFIDQAVTFDWASWHPERRTLWVLDRAGRDPDKCVATIRAIARARERSSIPVRVLCIDSEPSAFIATVDNPFNEDARLIALHRYAAAPLRIVSLPEAASRALFAKVHGDASPSADIIDEGIPRWLCHGTASGALSAYIKQAVVGVKGTELNLIALAQLAGVIPLAGRVTETAFKDLVGHDGYDANVIARVTGVSASAVVPAMSPTFVGDRYVIEHLMGPTAVHKRSTIVQHAWRLGPDNFLDFVARNARELAQHEAWWDLLATAATPPPVQWIGAVETAATVWAMNGDKRALEVLLDKTFPIVEQAPGLLVHWLHACVAYEKHPASDVKRIRRWLDAAWKIARPRVKRGDLAEALAPCVAILGLKDPKARDAMLDILRALAAERHPGALRVFMHSLMQKTKSDDTHAAATAEFLAAFAKLPMRHKRALMEERLRVAHEIFKRGDAAAQIEAFEAVKADAVGDDMIKLPSQLQCPDEERAKVAELLATLAAVACETSVTAGASFSVLPIAYDLVALIELAPHLGMDVDEAWLAVLRLLVDLYPVQSDQERRFVGVLGQLVENLPKSQSA